MTFLPIVERELRVAARRGTTHWARFALTAVLALVTVNHFGGSGAASSGSAGRSAFIWLLSAAFLLVCAACALTADALSAEQREGTLGLLFLTDLHPWDITLGKLASVGLGAVYAGMAFVPLLMLPLLAGGVSGAEAARNGLALLATLLFTLTAGLAASARETERMRAITKAALLVIATVLLPLVAAWPGLFSPVSLMALLSPLTTLRLAQDSAYRTTPVEFWASLALQLAHAALLLVGAGTRLRRNLLEPVFRVPPPPEEPAPYSVEPASNASHALANPAGPKNPRPFDEARPLEWLVQRQRGQQALCWTAAALMFASSLLTPGLLQGLGGFRVGGGTASGWHYLYQLWWLGDALLAWAACRFFFEARRSGELELLLTTPVGARGLVAAHGAAMKQFLLWPMALAFAPLLLPPAVQVLSAGGVGRVGTYQFYAAVYGILHSLEMLLAVLALNWLGMLFGLTARRLVSAVALTLGLAVGFPIMAHSLFQLVVRPLILSRVLSTTWLHWSLTYYPLNCVFLLALTYWARRRLRQGALSEPMPLVPRFLRRGDQLSHQQ